MNKNNFKSVYSQANILYGTLLNTTDFEDVALNGWERIGNKQTRLYRYTGDTKDKRLRLPCNVEIIEAVFGPYVEAQVTSDASVYPNFYNKWVEEYIESWKRNNNIFYDKGMLLKYRKEDDELVFSRDYNNVTVLYHGIIVDEDGLPYLTDKEVQALAAYCAYVNLYKKSLIQRDGNLFQMATAVKADWLRLCNSARIPDHLTQNDLNDVLEVKTCWNRKMYGKSFHPIL